MPLSLNTADFIVDYFCGISNWNDPIHTLLLWKSIHWVWVLQNNNPDAISGHLPAIQLKFLYFVYYTIY